MGALSQLLVRLGYGEADESTLHERILARCRAIAGRAALSRADLQMLHGLLARLDPRTC